MADLTCAGERTLLWDAVAEAASALATYAAENAGCRLRVLALTDGKDEGSRTAPAAVLQELARHGIILDSVVVGPVPDFSLDAAAKFSGGTAHRLLSWSEAQAQTRRCCHC